MGSKRESGSSVGDMESGSGVGDTESGSGVGDMDGSAVFCPFTCHWRRRKGRICQRWIFIFSLVRERVRIRRLDLMREIWYRGEKLSPATKSTIPTEYYSYPSTYVLIYLSIYLS